MDDYLDEIADIESRYDSLEDVRNDVEKLVILLDDDD